MNSTIAAIDFGTSKIVTVIAENGGLNKLSFLGTGNVPYNGWMDGDWIDDSAQVTEAIRNSVSAAELEAKTHIREVYVGVPSGFLKTLCCVAETEITGESGHPSEEDLLAVADAAAEELGLPQEGAVVIHRSPAWYQVDEGKQTMSPSNQRGKTLRARISFILADEFFTKEVSEMLGKLGITVLGFLSPTFGEAMLLLNYDDRDRTSVLVDGGYLITEVSVVRGDAIVYHAELPIGCGHITAALAENLQIPMKSAERVKREFKLRTADFDPDFDELKDVEVRMENGRRIRFKNDVVQTIMRGKLEEIARMIESAMEEAADDLQDKSQVFLTGGLSRINGMREFLSDHLRRAVKQPLLHATKLNSGQFASAQGLVDLVFDSIEGRTVEDDSFPVRLMGSVKGFINKTIQKAKKA